LAFFVMSVCVLATANKRLRKSLRTLLALSRLSLEEHCPNAPSACALLE